VPSPIWSRLLLLAMLLLPIDIAVRRLVVTRSDWIKLWNIVFGTAQTATIETSERMSSLLSARDRAREQLSSDVPTPAATISALRRRREEPGSTSEAGNAAVSSSPASTPPATTVSGKTSFAALRERQQRAREEREVANRPVRPSGQAGSGSSTSSTPKPSSTDRPKTSGNIGARLLKRRRDNSDDDE